MMTKELIDGGGGWRRQPEGTEAEVNGRGRVVIDFDLARAQFVARAAAPDIAANVLKLGYVLAYKHMNVASMTATVGQEVLAADLSVTVRSIQNLLPKLTPIGLVLEPGDGRSKLSVYRIGSGALELESAKAASKGRMALRPLMGKRRNPIRCFPKCPRGVANGWQPRASRRFGKPTRVVWQREPPRKPIAT